MKNNKTLILFIILIVLIIIIIYLIDAGRFHPPKFDKNAKSFEEIKENMSNNLITVNDDYAFYIDGEPILKDGYLYINFYSLANENIYLKVRILENDEIITESGLLKRNEYLEKIKYSSKNKKLTYLIMSYEKDTYFSMGEVRLNAMIGDQE